MFCEPVGARAIARVLPATALGVLGAVLLAGCSTGTAIQHETMARQDIQVTASHYRPHGAKPPLPVLTDNSTLTDLMQYALLNNPKVESSYYEWAGAVEDITTARSLPDPMLTLGAEISNGLPSLSAALMSDPGMNWPGAGKLPLRGEAAYGGAEKKRAVFENDLLDTALAVKRAYYQMWVLEEQIRWTREVLGLVGTAENVARQRMAVGKVTQQDVLRAQMEQERLKNQLVNLEDSRATVCARLRSALGLRPDEPLPSFVLRLDPTAANFTEQSLLDTAFTRNPRLKQMRGEVLQAMALYQLARKSTVPDYSWGLGVRIGIPPAITPSFGMTLPIWRDKIRAEIASGESGVNAANAKLSAEELDLAVRFAETAYSWREADRNVTLYDNELLPRAKAALDSARGGYVSGPTGFPDLLDAERTLLEYHMSRAEAAGQREMVLAEMSLVILGRWPENVQPLLQESPSGTTNSLSQ
jgi:outer membrane protein TolC